MAKETIVGIEKIEQMLFDGKEVIDRNAELEEK